MPQSWDDPNVQIDDGAQVARSTIFEPVDLMGNAQPIVIGRGCRIAPGAVIYGGVDLDEGSRWCGVLAHLSFWTRPTSPRAPRSARDRQ
jgi:hypothetical protein